MSMALSINLFAQDTIRMVWEGWTVNSFSITATSGELFHVDWGDDSPIQSITAIGFSQYLNHSYDNISNYYTVTIFAANVNCLFTYFYCADRLVTSLDVSNSTNLLGLDCGTNKLSTLDVSSNTNLTHLSCNDNLLSTLDVSNNTNLTHLCCEWNQLSTLDISSNTNLIVLWCYHNQLSTLDVSSNRYFTTLWCFDNQLSTLNVSNNDNLTDLQCDLNQLNTLDVSSNANLTQSRCRNNQLSTLDVSNNTQLEVFDCRDNQLLLSDLYVASEQISIVNNKYLGTQQLPAQVTLTDIALFSSQTEFDGVATVFDVKKDGVTAPTSDYIINNGLVFLNTGNYTVTMTNGAILSAPYYPAKVIVDITVNSENGIVETYSYPSLRIYPNPATTHLYVKLAEPQTTDYSIYNIMGQVVKQGTLQGDDVINVTSLVRGTYFLKIVGATAKFVVVRD